MVTVVTLVAHRSSSDRRYHPQRLRVAIPPRQALDRQCSRARPPRGAVACGFPRIVAAVRQTPRRLVTVATLLTTLGRTRSVLSPAGTNGYGLSRRHSDYYTFDHTLQAACHLLCTGGEDNCLRTSGCLSRRYAAIRSIAKRCKPTFPLLLVPCGRRAML